MLLLIGAVVFLLSYTKDVLLMDCVSGETLQSLVQKQIGFLNDLCLENVCAILITLAHMSIILHI